MKNTIVFKDTNSGLHPGHHQTYALLRNYEKPYKSSHISPGNIMTLVKNVKSYKKIAHQTRHKLKQAEKQSLVSIFFSNHS